MASQEIPTVVIKAAAIVSHDFYGQLKLLCFKYDREDLNRLKEFEGKVCNINLEDESGSFNSQSPFKIDSVDAPNRFTRCPDNVLIIDLSQPECDHDWPIKDGQTDMDDRCTKCGESFTFYIHS